MRRKLKVSYRTVMRGRPAHPYRVPRVILAGRWLEVIGIGIADSVQVAADSGMPGKLIIQKEESHGTETR